MDPEAPAPRWSLVLAATVLVLIPAVVFASNSGPAPSALGAAGRLNAPPFVSRVIHLDDPAPVASWGAPVNLTLGVDRYSIWLDSWYGANPGFVHGTVNVSGLWSYTFLLLGPGIADPSNSTTTWVSPDGNAAASWAAFGDGGITLVVWASQPSTPFRTEQFQLPLSASNTVDNLTRFGFDGAAWSLVVLDWFGPAGPSLQGEVRTAVGATWQLGFGGPEITGCELLGGEPDLLGSAWCYEWASPDGAVGLVWDGASGGFVFADGP